MKSIKVAAAVIERDGRILATQRGYGEFEGWWEFPGGKVEPGETSEQALRRELEEEMAAEVEIERPLVGVSYDYPAFHLDMDCFLCTLTNGSYALLEHSAARWLDADGLRSVGWLPADDEVLSAIESQGVLAKGR
ncbi:MAG: (deoxy)nucleoside triphosphate pyrophosphohydrolase [Atopobiaceae bacterium]|jgi:8-oxo-dGTP diphosphatase